MVNKIKFNTWPNFSKEESELVKKVIKSNKVNYWTGNKCRKFELEFSKLFGIKYSVAVMNGSVALETALKAIGISNNDEVIVTSKSFIISASAVLNVGAKPIFSDVDYNSQNIDPNYIKKIITKKTKAIIVVHLGGWPCKMQEIINIAKKNSIRIIEDCSQAHGAKIQNNYVGSFGDMAIWSFCNDKIITTGGEGGMISTNNKKFYEIANAYKDHGKNFKKIKKNKKKIGFQFVHDNPGTNYRMTEMQAVIGLYQLKKLKKWVNRRFELLKYFWKKTTNIDKIYTPVLPLNITHAAYRMYVYIHKDFIQKKFDIKKIIKHISTEGVPCSNGSCSEIYKENLFKKYFKNKKIIRENAHLLERTSLSFPVNPYTTKKEVDRMVKSLKNAVMN